jgi:hypothetical protein
VLTKLLAKAALYLIGAPLFSEKHISNQQKHLAGKSLKFERQKLKRNNTCQKNAPLPGDVIYVKRMGDLYRHYGIYAGNNRVIHYAGHGGDWGEDVSIHEAPLRDFLQGARRFTVCEFKTHCDISGYHLYSREETLQREYQRLGEQNYNLITNNCEHFALWCRTGISASPQVKEAGKTICGLFDLVDLLLE